MKFLLLVSALTCLCAGDDASNIMPDPSWATLVNTLSESKLKDDPICSSIYSCKDCHTARVCRPNTNGGYEVLQTVECSGGTPFCDPASGSCVSEEPESCGAADSFVCLDNGKYPDADCRRFHVCLELQSFTFQCAVEGESYNALTKICDVSSNCGSFDCAGNEGRKIPHSEYQGYYAFCQNNNGPLVIDSCPGNYELNVTSQICEPPCKTEGIIADVTECHHYFKCTKIYVRRDLTYMQRDRLMCPEGQAYSTKDYLCVDEANVSSCQH